MSLENFFFFLSLRNFLNNWRILISFFLSCSILFGEDDFWDFADVDFLNFGLKSSLKLKSSKFTVNFMDSGTENQWK